MHKDSSGQYRVLYTDRLSGGEGGGRGKGERGEDARLARGTNNYACYNRGRVQSVHMYEYSSGYTWYLITYRQTLRSADDLQTHRGQGHVGLPNPATVKLLFVRLE